MRVLLLVSMAAATQAIVMPDQDMASRIFAESGRYVDVVKSKLPSKTEVTDTVEKSFTDVSDAATNALDDALKHVSQKTSGVKQHFQCWKSATAFDPQSWLESASDYEKFIPTGKSEDGDASDLEAFMPTTGHKKSNLTVYQLIAKSEYTSKLADLINEHPDLVKVLNSTDANYTVFAPTNAAFDKIPKHGKHPSKEIIKKILLYHVSGDFYPAQRVLVTHTVPTLLEEEHLGDKAQRIRLGLTLKGLTANLYSRIVAVNIFGSNGVIHGVDTFLLPPPSGLQIVDFLPTVFSTLELGLLKTGLSEVITEAPHHGGTLFAPDNGAFAKLGFEANGFLFSKWGTKYLRALLQYHVVANQTLYSDAFYKADSSEVEDVPKGYYHVDLPTILDDKHLSIDVARYGGFINLRINGYSNVKFQDGIARDGVIQVSSDVLIPPKQHGSDDRNDMYSGGEISVEDLKERLEPYVVHRHRKGVWSSHNTNEEQSEL